MRPPRTPRQMMSVQNKFSISLSITHELQKLEDLDMARACFQTSLTGFLMLLVVLLASFRRRSKSQVLKAIVWSSYTLSGYLIAFTMGQMIHSVANKSDDGEDIFWAMYLLVAFGSADSFSSYSLLDSEQWRRYSWQMVAKLGGLVILLSPAHYLFTNPIYAVMIPLLTLVITSKASMKNLALEASDMPALHRSCKDIEDYMRREYEEGDPAHANPLTMKGYRYLVQGEAPKTRGPIKTTDLQGVTIEEVWNCRWKLLSSNGTGNRLKDLCLSFSLFRLLRAKYAGYKLPLGAHQKTLRLVRVGLMELGEDGYERAFRVVEDELALLFDSFYTKRPIIFDPHAHRLCIRFAESLLLGLISCVLIYALFGDLRDDLQQKESWTYILYDMIALIAVMTYLLSESLQCFALLFTTWIKVMTICKYVKGDLWQKRPLRRKCVEIICKLSSDRFKPWERKLHQYCLLESCTYSPFRLFPKRFVYMFLNYTRDGQKEGVPVNVSADVMKAVFDCLKEAFDSQSDDGIPYLRKPDLSNALILWECDLHHVSEFKTQAEVVMVWHIATTLYEGKTNSDEGRANSTVARTLSKYLAYLVAFAPRLLPGHPYDTELLFDQTITDASNLLKGCRELPEKVNKLLASASAIEAGDNKTVLFRAARLAIQLSDANVDPDEIWKNLAKFWAEMMLYVAPSKDDRAHAERLAYGGEFVTHLWALLYHAGIKRRKCDRPDHPDESGGSETSGGLSRMLKTSEPKVPPISTENEYATDENQGIV